MVGREGTKSPSRSPAIHSTFTGTRTFGLRRHLHCLQAQTHSSSTPPSKIVRHQSDSIGKVVLAIFKIEDGTLTLAGIGTVPKRHRKALKTEDNVESLRTPEGSTSKEEYRTTQIQMNPQARSGLRWCQETPNHALQQTRRDCSPANLWPRGPARLPTC